MTINELVEKYKGYRNFNVENYVEKKVKRINDFFRDQNLDGVVLGISGGIDSAVALGLLHRASKVRNSPIRQICPITIPIRDVKGVTGQSESKQKAYLVMEHFGYSGYTINLTNAYQSIVWESCDIDPDNKDNVAWAEGQMASVLRTPVLYFHAAILQVGGYKTLVSGTINNDEGSYIGFFGKASDAMVDLQPIADLHKSEVYAVAEYLHIPEEIIKATPKGDVWDGKVDEEMIGAPYWFIELYMCMKRELWSSEDIGDIIKSLNDEDFKIFQKYQKNIENLHQINAHKYAVGNPAHFIDVMERRVPGGW